MGTRWTSSRTDRLISPRLSRRFKQRTKRRRRRHFALAPARTHCTTGASDQTRWWDVRERSAIVARTEDELMPPRAPPHAAEGHCHNRFTHAQAYGSTSIFCLRPYHEPRRTAILICEHPVFDPIILLTIVRGDRSNAPRFRVPAARCYSRRAYCALIGCGLVGAARKLHNDGVAVTSRPAGYSKGGLHRRARHCTARTRPRDSRSMERADPDRSRSSRCAGVRMGVLVHLHFRAHSEDRRVRLPDARRLVLARRVVPARLYRRLARVDPYHLPICAYLT